MLVSLHVSEWGQCLWIGEDERWCLMTRMMWTYCANQQVRRHILLQDNTIHFEAYYSDCCVLGSRGQRSERRFTSGNVKHQMKWLSYRITVFENTCDKLLTEHVKTRVSVSRLCVCVCVCVWLIISQFVCELVHKNSINRRVQMNEVFAV